MCPILITPTLFHCFFYYFGSHWYYCCKYWIQLRPENIKISSSLVSVLDSRWEASFFSTSLMWAVAIKNKSNVQKVEMVVSFINWKENVLEAHQSPWPSAKWDHFVGIFFSIFAPCSHSVLLTPGLIVCYMVMINYELNLLMKNE